MFRPITITITSAQDIPDGRHRSRELAARIGFSAKDQIAIATAISEIGLNILDHARSGEIVVSTLQSDSGGPRGIQAVARATGPAVPPGESQTPAGSQPSLRLKSTRRVMDEFELSDGAGQGTTITVRKFLR